jgi:hypothetical protein
MDKRKPLLPVKSDFVFKAIFGDQRNVDILAEFLQSVLDIGQGFEVGAVLHGFAHFGIIQQSAQGGPAVIYRREPHAAVIYKTTPIAVMPVAVSDQCVDHEHIPELFGYPDFIRDEREVADNHADVFNRRRYLLVTVNHLMARPPSAL